mmetsp:Transcript_96958/g.269773  ORF Transcript_96958/g.269773 Transcript_96958/m.269773 type:complete len:499 (+) Transcript_96958:192-1688(+)
MSRLGKMKSMVVLKNPETRNKGVLRPCGCLESVLQGLLNLNGSAGEVEAQRSLREEVERTADPKAVACENLVLVMVGLPARGKSYLSGAVLRHLRLLGVRVRNFNAGELRRQTDAAGGKGAKADFFSATNEAAKAEREKLAMMCCNALLHWLRQAPPNTSSVGILDATNTTEARRRRVLALCRDTAREMAAEDGLPLRVIFLESICNDPSLLKGNYVMKLRNDDYRGAADAEAALQDFKTRVQAYEQQYQPLDERELECFDGDFDVQMPVGCVQIFDGGRKIVCCRTGSSLVAAPIISLLLAMHLMPRRILLAAQRSEAGEEVEPERLEALLLSAEEEEGQPIDVLCSASRRGVELAQHLERLGCCSGDVAVGSRARHEQPRAVLTLRALQTRSAVCNEAAEENYADLVRRMRAEVLLLIERLPRSVLVFCPSEDVRRVLLAHFIGCQSESLADMQLPGGKVLELSRDHKGYTSRELPYPPPPSAKDTTRVCSRNGTP